MTNENIIRFAKDYLQCYRSMDEFQLQSFIYAREEVAKRIPLGEIRNALEGAWKNGILDIVIGSNERTIYKLSGYEPQTLL